MSLRRWWRRQDALDKLSWFSVFVTAILLITFGLALWG